MNINLKKLIQGMVAAAAALVFLTSCDAGKKGVYEDDTVLNDCSTIFETRYIGDAKSVAAYKQSQQQNVMKPKQPTECKVLEVKLDNDTKCEVVGSDRIDNLTKVLEENAAEKIILITPEKKVRDLGQLAQKYMSSNGIDILKYFDSEIFKSMNFAYKGLRCEISEKEFVIWSGDKKVILTVGNL